MYVPNILLSHLLLQYTIRTIKMLIVLKYRSPLTEIYLYETEEIKKDVHGGIT